MTAEIAILNKSAVALAADSAVTVCAGDTDEKVFDSADKLFELSDKNSIGIMIYNTMSFMGAPLPTLIRRFRSDFCDSFDHVEDVAAKFLEFLNDFGKKSPSAVKDRSIEELVRPLFSDIGENIQDDLIKRIMKAEQKKSSDSYDPSAIIKSVINKYIRLYEYIYTRRKDALFVGEFDFVFSVRIEKLIGSLIDRYIPAADAEQKARLLEIGKLVLRRKDRLGGQTGIVVAGFGAQELFPTLVSYEIDGMICDHLKYVRTNFVKINQEEQNAQVIPFAQKEMVERFLYGLDDNIEREIVNFCRKNVTDIREEILKHVELDDEEAFIELQETAEEAEKTFLNGLKKRAFDEIRSDSRSEIEDMVEFMPKPELAKMAEALVELTSIKRRVTRGMETVGGPIDVAVISQSEGFVWIRRKHYFPAELNSRYFSRLNRKSFESKESGNGKNSTTRQTNATRRRKTKNQVGSAQEEWQSRASDSGGNS